MERDNFDTELFIDEVEKRVAIWNMESPDYSNRNVKRRSWEELVEIFSEAGDSDEKKKTLGVTLQKKWKGLRDGFVREMKKNKNAPSGSGAPSKNSYIYFNRLMFLERSVSNKITDSNITSDMSADAEQNNSVDGEDVMRPPASNQRNKRKISAADTEFLGIIQKTITSGNPLRPSTTEETDDDKLFCLSLHKELLKVPEANRLQTKIEILNILQKGQQVPHTYLSKTTRPGYVTQYNLTQHPARHPLPYRPTSFQYSPDNYEYDPATPSISSNRPGYTGASYTTRTVQHEHEAYNPTPSPVSTIDSQDSSNRPGYTGASYTTRTVQHEHEAYNPTPSPVSTIDSQDSSNRPGYTGASYTTRTVQHELNPSPSPVSTIDSQGSDCMDLFQNNL